MRTASIIINAAIFVATFAVVISHFRKDGVWRFKNGVKQFRYFTVLSNTFCAIAALLMAISQIGGSVSRPVFLLKYLGTVSVTLTFLTVLLFLAPFQGGFAKWFAGDFFYVHLVGPLLAIASFCFLEKQPMNLGTAMLGLVPMLLYGAVYVYKVMLAPEDERWKDFYGFNRNGMWLISGIAMIVGTSLICLAYWQACRV
ncbi:MAG: hypothetical protein IJI71_06600 [Clostridia bacterium]|nr:hypothetical protein [Clostridia bacterium]